MYRVRSMVAQCGCRGRGEAAVCRIVCKILHGTGNIERRKKKKPEAVPLRVTFVKRLYTEYFRFRSKPKPSAAGAVWEGAAAE